MLPTSRGAQVGLPPGLSAADLHFGKQKLQECVEVQHMIDINSVHLERLRASPSSGSLKASLNKAASGAI